MYKLHLILKYLRKRRIAWVSLIAVMLCTMMVLVVISVMGGWLRMFQAGFHGLSGDIIVRGESLTGFPDYEEMIERIDRLPNVVAAVPTIQTVGFVNIVNQIRQGVQVIGYPLDKIGQVNDFPQSLHRQYKMRRESLLKQAEAPGLTRQQREALRKQADEVPTPSFDLLPDKPYQYLLPAKSKMDALKMPGMIVGSGVVGIHKNEHGIEVGRGGVYDAWVLLTMPTISPDQARIDASSKGEDMFWIVDDSRTKIWQYDSKTVYVDFHRLQHDLKMDAFEDQPARTSDIQIKVTPGADLQQVKKDVEKIVESVRADNGELLAYPVQVETWEENPSISDMLSAVKNEKSLITFLFSLISIVAIFLIFCIFYMIVAEKTRDIGIIKSVGATNTGVAGIFLGYGLAIGIAGAGLGLLMGFLIVHNINYLHTELGRLLGIQIWNPKVYLFDTIPNTMNPNEVIVIIAVAVVSSVLGAMVPAIRAARMHPVEALRWE